MLQAPARCGMLQAPARCGMPVAQRTTLFAAGKV